MLDVSAAIVIARPRSEVAEYAANPNHAPEWYANIRSVEWKSPRPLRIGSQVAFVARFLGRRLSCTYEVVEFQPGERFVMRTAAFPMETTYAWESAPDGGTRMTLRNRGEPSGFSRIVSPFMAWAVRRANRKDLLALKARLERGTAVGRTCR